MVGRIKHMIDTIIEKRSNGDPAAIGPLRVKMILKGIYPDKYSSASMDDPVIIEKLDNLAKELGINF
jgi:hypothetical protein